MAMKPAGKAILIGLVAIVVAVGVLQSGVMSKLEKPAVVEAIPDTHLPEPQVIPQSSSSAKAEADAAVRAATAPQQPAAAPAQPSANDAVFDAMIKKAGQK